ncbi:hypothetical protein ACO0K9_20820 [Undibacterium sp. Ji50W]|uniref:hypothetical protein n=1 Tax=Undibacterium sp. Ji50W TaxID=3413041 RepID=UPI003BF13B8F
MGIGVLLKSSALGILLLVAGVTMAEEPPCNSQIEAVRSETKNLQPIRTILGEIFDEKLGYYTITYISREIEHTIFVDSVSPATKGCTIQRIILGLRSSNQEDGCKDSGPDFSEKQVNEYYYKELKYKPPHLEESFVTAPASEKSCYFFHQYLRKNIK